MAYKFYRYKFSGPVVWTRGSNNSKRGFESYIVRERAVESEANARIGSEIVKICKVVRRALVAEQNGFFR